jgi:uncharacterized lipoprotein YmbA
MIKVRVLISAVCAAVLLTACGTSPPVRFYTLDPLPGSSSAETPDSIIGIGPLRFPEYLKRPQIVSFGDSGEVVIAEFDRWAGAAEADFQRTLMQNLNRLLNNTMVIEFPFGGGLVSPDYRLVGQISQFSTDASGGATLDINWGIINADDEQVIPARRSVFSASSASASSYAARVAAMNETLQAFSRQVAELFQAAADQ